MKQTTRALLSMSVLCTLVTMSVDAAAETVVKAVPVLQAQGEAGGGQEFTKAQGYYRQGVEFMNSSRFLDAVEQFQLCIDEEGENVDCHRRLAFAYTSMGQTEADYYEDALDVYGDLQTLLPEDDVDVRKSIAFVQAAMGDMDDAIATFEEILEIIPEDCGVWNQIGGAEKLQADRIKAGSDAGAEDPAYKARIAKAVKAYTEVTTLCPDTLEAWQTLGDVYFNSGDYPKAADAFKSMLAIDDQNVEILSKLAYIYKESENWTEAAPVYEKILELDPSRVSARQGYGKSLQKQGSYADAVAQYQMIIDSDPGKYSSLYCNCANIYAGDAKDGEKAIQTAMKGIAVNAPVQGCLTYFWAVGLELRAKGLMLEGKYDRAIATYREAKLKFTGILGDANFGGHARKQLDRMDQLITIAEQTKEKAKQSGK